MYENFDELINAAIQVKPKKTICIAAAGNEKILHLVEELQKLDLCNMILVDDRNKIIQAASNVKADLENITIIHEPDERKVANTAVEQVSKGNADVFVKGKMNTSDFLHAVLDAQVGLRIGQKLSVLTCYDVPRLKKLIFMTDGGMIVAPNLEDKATLLKNAVSVLHNMGIGNPKIAILAANEKISAKIPATMDAAQLCAMARDFKLPKGIYEGPIAFDVAMNPIAAKEKGLDSKVSGDVDLFLAPNIEAGNCLGKAIGYFGGGDTAGIVLGAAKPVVMSSRSASIKGKMASIAWALLADKIKKGEE